MTLRWKDTMVTASFRGLEFPATRIQSAFGHALAVNSYPDVGGQDVEDQGRNAERWTVDFIFAASLANKWGDDIYPERWVGFKKRLDTKGSGELVLPEGGSVQAAVDAGSVDIDASREDQVSGTVTFVEDSLGAFALEDSTSLNRQGDAVQRAQIVDMHLALYEGIDTAPFAAMLTTMLAVLADPTATRYTVETCYSRIRSEIRADVDRYSSLQDPANWSVMEEIICFSSDLMDLVNGTERNFPLIKEYVTAGETDLFTLSMQLYGTRDRWEELQSLNAAVVPNPSRVTGGTKIVYYAA